jgi:hypothetical protein
MVVALAAFASVGFAAFRIATAVGNAGAPDEGASLSATSAEQARTLARLHAPPGFRKESCSKLKEKEAPAVCFFDPRPISINDSWMRRAVIGVGLDAWAEGDLGSCLHPASFGVRGLRFRACAARGHLGREEVSLFAHSLKVPRRPTHLKGVRKAERYWVIGTELTVVDGGHT